MRSLTRCSLLLLLLGCAQTALAQTGPQCGEAERRLFGEQLSRALMADDWGWIEARIHAIDLPDRWQEMIRPLTQSFAGRELSIEHVDFDDLPDHVREPLRALPADVAARTRHGILFSFRVSDGELSEFGSLQVPIFAGPAGCRILMAGDDT